MASQLAPDLNDRQRHYLLAAYQLDQEIEQQRRRDFARGNPDPERTPAAVWRAMPYGRWEHLVLEGKPPTPLRARLDPTLVSPGTGSTWKTLAERGLLTVEDRTIRFSFMSAREAYVLPHVSLTRAGRKLARELLGEVRPPRPKKPAPPVGLLLRTAWRVLARAYAQDEQGLAAGERDPFDYQQDYYGGMRQHQFGAAVEQGLLTALPAGTTLPERYCLTPDGRDYYERYYRVNAAAHPDVPAELPRPLLTHAQRAFWDEIGELRRRRDQLIGPTNDSRRAVLAVKWEILRHRLAAELGTLFIAPYWYPTLAGIGLATSGGRLGVALQLLTEQEARAEGELQRQCWQLELTLEFDYEHLPQQRATRKGNVLVYLECITEPAGRELARL